MKSQPTEARRLIEAAQRWYQSAREMAPRDDYILDQLFKVEELLGQIK